MLKRDKQELIGALKRSGYPSKDFLVVEDGIAVTIRHAPTKMEFKLYTTVAQTGGYNHSINFNRHNFRDGLFSPGGSKSTYGSLQQCIEWLEHWLQHEVNTAIEEDTLDDPFVIFFNETNKTIIDEVDSHDESSFTDGEKQMIYQNIDKFKYLLDQNFQFTSGQNEQITSELKYLKESVDKLNKRDWKSVALKVLYDIGIGIGGGLVVSGISRIPPLFTELVKQAFSISPVYLSM